MHVFHTLGVPPNKGRTILENRGCIENRRAELTTNVAAKTRSKAGNLPAFHFRVHKRRYGGKMEYA